MDFLWPRFIFLLGLIPLILAAYFLVMRRRRRFAVRFSSLSLVRQANPGSSRLRRYLPLALFLLGLACLIVALARPAAILSVPTDQTTIILAIDVSGSMRSTDVQPSRLAAAEAAMLSFIQRQKAKTQIGVVAFSGFAELIQPPTTDQEALQAAVESLFVGRRTAVGSGILKALDAIAEVDKNVASSTNDSSSAAEPTPVPNGAYAPDIIVLLTDGASNAGPLPLDAAKQAADRGVRVYTIGFGTPFGSIDFGGGGGGFFCGGSQQYYGGFQGGRFRTPIDEDTLKKIADATGGTYYKAESADELQTVFKNLPTYLITKHEVLEVSVIFAAAGALLAGLAVVLSLLWHPLP
jgi:Ca-activated chloride channel homolog